MWLTTDILACTGTVLAYFEMDEITLKAVKPMF